MTTSYDRITAALRHQTLDRIPMCESYYWPETIQRWRAEGLPADTDPVEYFGLDRIVTCNPVNYRFFPYEIIEETDTHITDVSPFGSIVKYPKVSGSSEGYVELDFKVRTINDWREVANRCLQPGQEYLTPPPTVPEGAFVTYTPHDHFWMMFRTCGMENMCIWMAEAGHEVMEICDDYTTFLLNMLDMTVARGDRFDALWFFSDMAYRNGPMFSPGQFDELFAPCYRRIRQWCDRHGKWMLLHSDGNMNALTPAIIEVGFDWLHPLEARAGNDVREYKQKLGDQLTLVGNINADVLADGDRRAIEREITEKIPQAKVGGGYIYHIDHSVPPTIAFDDYAYAMELVRQCGRY